MIGSEAIAEGAVEKQTKRTKKEMKQQVGTQTRDIEKAIDEALARRG